MSEERAWSCLLLMNWPFRELMLCIHQVLHVFSKSLVASVINSPPPHSFSPALLWCRALCHLGGAQMQSRLDMCRSPILSSGWTLHTPDSLLSSPVFSPLWTLNLNLHPGMPGAINAPCTKPPFLSTRPPFCRTGWGHCLVLWSPLTSSSSSFFLLFPTLSPAISWKLWEC